MIKSPSLSSDGGPSSPDDDVDSVCSDELLGASSRRWREDLMTRDLPPLGPEVNMLGWDGLFVDPYFPRTKEEMEPGVVWKRPKEICPSPQFIVNGATRLDVVQGALSDCWLLSAIASLSVHHSLLQKVMPLEQSFDKGYNGCFVFKFWQYGEWEEVRIDDLLPTKHNTLIYLSSPEKHEFWSSLLEKAYAKLKGGFGALEMGYPHEAMVDMTGGVTEVFKPSNEDPKSLPSTLRQLLDRGALINCANCQGPLEKKNEFGIMFRHAYSLTAVEMVQTSQGPTVLVRLLNPWGREEWLGPWSDMNGPEWGTVSAEEQRRLERINREDGEFWMSVTDFQRNFDTLEVCHLPNGLSRPGSKLRPWSCTIHHGNWVPNVSAGGSHKSGKFWLNPKFTFDLLEVDSGDDKNKCSFVLALMQKHKRRKGVDLAIGLHIYQIPDGNQHLSLEDLSVLSPVLYTEKYSQRREVVIRSSLPPGHYIIIPSTFHADQQGEFLLRVLTEQGNEANPAHKPALQRITSRTENPYPHQAALPPTKSIRLLFDKHCNKGKVCKPVNLHSLLTEALQGGVLAGSEQNLSLEHCKTLVILMDSRCTGQLNWEDFQELWNKIRRWTDIFIVFDKSQSMRLEYPEVAPALEAAGIIVDEEVMRLVGVRYTEPDLTVSYPGFLYLLMKLEKMIHHFLLHDMGGVGSMTISFRQWLRMTMYS